MNQRYKGDCPGAVVNEEKVFVAILKSAGSLSLAGEQLFKTEGLTSSQYNVLRILRGAGAEGLPCRAVGERMISHDPDMTRMLDRMEKQGWISRHRGEEDRRVVTTRITDAGLKLLKKLDQPVREMHKKQFRHMNSARLKALLELLEEVERRDPPPGE